MRRRESAISSAVGIDAAERADVGRRDADEIAVECGSASSEVGVEGLTELVRIAGIARSGMNRLAGGGFGKLLVPCFFELCVDFVIEESGGVEGVDEIAREGFGIEFSGD